MHSQHASSARLFMEGGSLQLVAGSLGLACLLLDFGWTQPAIPNEWDPKETNAAQSLMVSGVAIMYVFASVPATIVYWRFVRAGTAARMLHLFLGCLLLLLVLKSDARARDFYTEAQWRGAHWSHSIVILSVSILFSAVGYLSSFAFEEGPALRWVVRTLLSLPQLFADFFSVCVSRLKSRRLPPQTSPSDSLDEPLIDAENGTDTVNEQVDDDASQAEEGSTANASNEDVSGEEPVQVPAIPGQPRRQTVHFQQVRREFGATSPLGAFCRAGHAPFIFGCSAYILALAVCAFSMILSFFSFEPSTHCFAWLKSTRVTTLQMELLDKTTAFPIGDHLVLSLGINETILVQDTRHKDLVIWQSLPNQAFIVGGVGLFEAWSTGGMFSFLDTLSWNSDTQTIHLVEVLGNGVKMSGSLFSSKAETFSKFFNYSATFQPVTGDVPQEEGLPIGGFELRIELFAPDGVVPSGHGLRLYTVYSRHPEELFYGFGTQLSYVGLGSGCVPILSREKGFGRGIQPFTFLMNRFNRDTGGSWQQAHTAIPYYLTSLGRSSFVDHAGLSVFDLSRNDRVTVEFSGSQNSNPSNSTALDGVNPSLPSQPVFTLSSRFYGTTSNQLREEPEMEFSWPASLLSASSHGSGKQGNGSPSQNREIPEWVGNGMIVDVGGGSASVLYTLRKLRANRIPVAAVIIQDWTGEVDTEFGYFPLFNWSPSKKRYPDWNSMLEEIRTTFPEVKILVYFSPYLVNSIAQPQTRSKKDRNNQRRENADELWFYEAEQQGCLVMTTSNKTYIRAIDESTGQSFGTVQLLEDRCVEWFGDKVVNTLLNFSTSVDGWLADHGDGLPISSLKPQSENKHPAGSEGHNMYVRKWQETNDRIVANFQRLANRSDTLVLTKCWANGNQYSPLKSLQAVHTLGYQLSSWDSHDGLASVVKGALSSGMSGIPMTTSFIGGVYNARDAFGLIRILRTEELLLRWLEYSAFADTVFISHRGKSLTSPVPTIPQVTDNQVLGAVRQFAGVHRHLWKYKSSLVATAMRTGLPLVRHMWFQFPHDTNTAGLDRQLMLGSYVLFCPVLQAGVDRVDCYIPVPPRVQPSEGPVQQDWVNFWNNETISPSQWRTTISCFAPIGKPCVWIHPAAYDSF